MFRDRLARDFGSGRELRDRHRPPGAQGTYETQPRLIAERREDGRRSQQR